MKEAAPEAMVAAAPKPEQPEAMFSTQTAGVQPACVVEDTPACEEAEQRQDLDPDRPCRFHVYLLTTDGGSDVKYARKCPKAK